MLAAIHATTLVGIEAQPVRVEVACSRGPSSFELVGLAHASVRESRVRVNAALAQLGICLGEHRITVNLAPADVRKSGTAFDLAIAVATLAAMGRVPTSALSGTLVLGELSLDGSIKPIRGALAHLAGARKLGLTRAILPLSNEREAGYAPSVEVLVADTLASVCQHLTGERVLPRAPERQFQETSTHALDLCDVKGQEGGRRALEVAAAGSHNLLFIGPPGGGKTMLARRLPGILPGMSLEEALSASTMHSVAGLLPEGEGLLGTRPFRNPHHSVSEAGLIGGGDPPRPGEVSLAHHGVLFLDELQEFRRAALEALRQPLEDGHLTLSRARYRTRFPARPMVIGAVNPCPCGYAGDAARPCVCSEERTRSYRARLSGPLVDRIDLHVKLPSIAVSELCRASQAEGSAAVRARVGRAREVQRERARAGEVESSSNAYLTSADLMKIANPDDAGMRLLTQAADKLGLSARAYAKVLKVARTIADLEGSVAVRSPHIAEAVHGRALDHACSPRV